MNIQDQVASRISAFSTLPVIAQRLLAVLSEAEPDVSKIEQILKYDPALTANVLKAANSAFLGFSNPVGSIAEACYRIGTKWTFQIAFSSLIYSNLNTPADGYGLSGKDLWRHSIAVGMMAEALCGILRVSGSGAIFTGGLVHDIGKVAIQDGVRQSFNDLQTLIETENIPFEEAERRLLSTDHAEVGAMIAANWHFPQSIVDMIRWHHNPDGAGEPTAAIDIVHTADAICLMEGLGIGNDGLQYRYSEGSFSRLKLSSEMVETAVSQVLISIESMEDMFMNTNKLQSVGR